MPPTYSDYVIHNTSNNFNVSSLLVNGYIPFGSPFLKGSETFQAFVLPVEKPSESKKIHESPEVENLIEKIQLTNNGYLFAPSESEITLAKKFPDVFNYINVQSGLFPHRISLK